MQKQLLSLLVLGFAGLGFAAHEYSDDDWANNLDYVLEDLAPLWYFSDGSCYPQAAEVDGQQTNGNAASGCDVDNGLANGCQSPGNWEGAATRGTSFPTYWTYTDCSDGTRRVCYDIYFRHDSGHEFDWEWACVVLSKDANNLWFRNGIILEQDNKFPGQTGTPYYAWGDLETWDAGQDPTDTSQTNGNHAMIYSAEFHHTMFTYQYTCLGKDNCVTDVQQMFRNNDFVWAAADYLAPGELIPQSWNWGAASSSPLNLNASVCSYALNGPGYGNPPGC